MCFGACACYRHLSLVGSEDKFMSDTGAVETRENWALITSETSFPGFGSYNEAYDYGVLKLNLPKESFNIRRLSDIIIRTDIERMEDNQAGC